MAVLEKKRKKITQILAEETFSKSYKAHKYSLDSARFALEYNEAEYKTFVWMKRGESDPPLSYKSLDNLACRLSASDEQILTYFLDGSRRVYKADDMAYTQSGNRSVICPIIAGQVGVGICKRLDKKMSHEALKKEIVLSVPSIANPNGKDGFFEALSVLVVVKQRQLVVEHCRSSDKASPTLITTTRY